MTEEKVGANGEFLGRGGAGRQTEAIGLGLCGLEEREEESNK